jgi:hypothetical protein
MIRLIILISFVFFSFASLYSKDISGDVSDSIKAKIAILHKAGDSYSSLRSKDRLRAGEMLRIFVQPINKSFIYVVHADIKEATLLYRNDNPVINEILLLPSSNDFYVFDDSSPEAKIIIFCSAKRSNELEKLFLNKESISRNEWNKFEKNILKEHKKYLNDKTDKPFPIAGNVSSVNDEFLDQVQTFVGKNIVIRKYELEIKK